MKRAAALAEPTILVTSAMADAGFAAFRAEAADDCPPLPGYRQIFEAVFEAMFDAAPARLARKVPSYPLR